MMLGWCFVLSRFLHTYIHLGSNHILYRLSAFFLGWVVVLALWVILLYQHFQAYR